ncbi:Hypothetical membrane protein [Propionibacterium freudenreichii]|nr:Hypothetical membrane protein [Propionibacterium freudenreichii]
MVAFPRKSLSELTRRAVPSLRARRSPRLIIIGVLCACLGGLGCAVAWHQATDARQVVVMVRAVPRGATIDGADLGTTSIGSAPGVATIGAEQLSTLIGTTALVELQQGMLVPASALGEETVRPGRHHVGVHLVAGRVPGDLVAGSAVIISAAPGPTDDASFRAEQLSVPATIVGTPSRQSDGSWNFDLDVPAGASLRIATLAAAGRLVVVHGTAA